MSPQDPEDTTALEPQERASILIVDDLPEKLLVFGTLLEDMGQDLVYARSGAEALREVLKREFAVILLDVNMPEMDGFETASMIRKYRRSAHTPIIFITAYADEIQTARGYSLGAVDYILSPVVPQILRTKIQVFVDLFLLQRRIKRQADERIALAAAEAARRLAEENTQRSNYLARASRKLGDSLDVNVAIHRILTLVVPELAELGVVLLADESFSAYQPQAKLLQMAWGTDLNRKPLITGHACSDLPASVVDTCVTAFEGRHTIALSAQDLTGLSATVQRTCALSEPPPLVRGMMLPMIGGERTSGILIVASQVGDRDWSVLHELASRAAIALGNARLYSNLQDEIIERRAAEFQLQASNQRKDEFLAMLSHELRNPLAPIRNAVEVVRQLAPSDPKLQWANDVMDRQVRHLTHLVEELLDVARISQGKIALQMEPVDLRAIIEHGVETVRPYIEHRQHSLTLTLPDHPVWLRGDFARLSQVVANLLNNAAKYTETGGAVSLSLSVEAEQAVITVSDNGIGIEPDLLPHVFELFEQGRRSLDRSQGGLGVGLTLVQRLVELHHGRIQASSKGHGQGATFQVKLPCMASSPVVSPEEMEPVVPMDTVGCRVLVVDDNCDAAESVAMVLSLHGHEVMTESDGMQALARVESFRPDAVVLDIGLPGIDGYDVARRLRRTPATSHALLIALTGYGQREDVARATEAGFDHHFVKPADPQALAHCIAQARLKGAELVAEADV
ncbi:MAG: response regulator [Acidobacteriota bacterium]